MQNTPFVNQTTGKPQNPIVDNNGAIITSGGGGQYNTTPPTYTNGQTVVPQYDVNGNFKVVEQFSPKYEDNFIGVALVESRGLTFRVTADGQVKATPGMLLDVEIAPVGVVTAGVITIYDSLTETGTVLFSIYCPVGFTAIRIRNKVFNTGCYIGYDASVANIQVSGQYR